MPAKTPTRQYVQGRRPGAPPLDLSDRDDLLRWRNLESFRLERDHAEAIQRVISGLRAPAHPILRDLDRRYYRNLEHYAHVQAARALVETKLAESVVYVFEGIRNGVRHKAKRDLAHLRNEAWADVAKYAARKWRGINPKLADKHTRDAEFFAGIVKSWKGKMPELHSPWFRDLPMSRYLDLLTLDLVAIFRHTTDLAPQYVAKWIVPEILSEAWKCYPDCAPVRGKANPLKRYKDAEKRLLSPRDDLGIDGFTVDDYLSDLRAILFDGDERFNVSLFKWQRPIRGPRRTPLRRQAAQTPA